MASKELISWCDETSNDIGSCTDDCPKLSCLNCGVIDARLVSQESFNFYNCK